jgi:hypothetical protein
MQFVGRGSEPALTESKSNCGSFDSDTWKVKTPGTPQSGFGNPHDLSQTRGDTLFDKYLRRLDASASAMTCPAARKQSGYRGCERGIHDKSPLST